MEKRTNESEDEMKNLLQVVDEREYTSDEIQTIRVLIEAIKQKKEEEVTQLEATFLLNWYLAEDRRRVDDIMSKEHQTEDDIDFMADWVLREWDTLDD